MKKKTILLVNKSLYFVFLFACLLYLFPCIYKNIIDSNVFIYTSSTTPWNSPWTSSHLILGYLQVYLKFFMGISICPFTSPDLYKILHGYLYLSISSWLSRYLHVSRLCPCIHGHLQVFMKLIIHGYLAVFIKFFHGISISNVVSIKISIAISIYVTIRISTNIPHVWECECTYLRPYIRLIFSSYLQV